NFYYSPSRLKQKRAYELQKRKYTARLCSDERRYATSSRKMKPIMFVGDRGLGKVHESKNTRDTVVIGNLWSIVCIPLYV
ncbi:hypothetical protein BCV72DRAFT_197766, partial [Rhizopus microsporus var. microsporus]